MGIRGFTWGPPPVFVGVVVCWPVGEVVPPPLGLLGLKLGGTFPAPVELLLGALPSASTGAGGKLTATAAINRIAVTQYFFIWGYGWSVEVSTA